MTDRRIVLSQFCDDIRQELGNKYSLMGCYGDEIIIDKLPIALPKLCVQLRAVTPLERPFKRLAFRALLNDDILAEIELPQEQLDHASKKICERENATRLTYMVIMGFTPLLVNEAARLRIEAETEEGVLNGGCINLRERKPEESPI